MFFSSASFLNKNKKKQNMLCNTNSKEDNLTLINNQCELEENTKIVKNNVFKDLEVFSGNEKKEESIFNTINKTTTLFGELFLKNILVRCIPSPKIVFSGFLAS